MLPRVTHEVPTDTADGVNGVTLVQIMLFPSQGILLVFNSEKQETFNSLDDWLEEIEEVCIPYIIYSETSLIRTSDIQFPHLPQ